MGVRSNLIAGVLGIAACGTAATPADVETTEVATSVASTGAGAPECPPVPEFTCTVPFDGTGWGCSADPRDYFDAECCLRPACQSNAECDEGFACAPAGTHIGCSDQIEDGQTVCRCGADPGGAPRSICMPTTAASTDWCWHHYEQATCDADEPIERTEGSFESCRWMETYNLLNDGSSCNAEPSFGRCVTIRHGADPGCDSAGCTAPGGAIAMLAPWYSPDHYEAIDAATLCDLGAPAGPWVPVADAAADLGPCAFTCE